MEEGGPPDCDRTAKLGVHDREYQKLTAVFHTNREHGCEHKNLVESTKDDDFCEQSRAQG